MTLGPNFKLLRSDTMATLILTCIVGLLPDTFAGPTLTQLVLVSVVYKPMFASALIVKLNCLFTYESENIHH